MKVAVVYSSRRGSTAKVARAIAEVFGAEAKRPAELMPQDLKDLDLLFVGSGVYFSQMEEDLENLLRNIPAGGAKAAAAFCTYQHYNLGTVQHIADMLASRDIPVVAKFCCHGRFFFLKRRHPDENDLQNAREFAKKTAALAEKQTPQAAAAKHK